MSPYLIAMSGGSGSGKSTVADALVEQCQHIGIVVFHEDGYYWHGVFYSVLLDQIRGILLKLHTPLWIMYLFK